jgi:hypothetical protein
MAAATTTKTDATAVDPAVAEAEVAAKAAEPVIEREFEVVRDFASHIGTQLLRFAKGDILGSHPGETLHAQGAPVKPLA